MLHVGFPYTDRIPIYICIMLYISFDLYLGEVTYCYCCNRPTPGKLDVHTEL